MDIRTGRGRAGGGRKGGLVLLSGNFPEVYAGGQEGQGWSQPVYLPDPSLGAEPLPPPELCLPGLADIRMDVQRAGRGLRGSRCVSFGPLALRIHPRPSLVQCRAPPWGGFRSGDTADPVWSLGWHTGAALASEVCHECTGLDTPWARGGGVCRAVREEPSVVRQHLQPARSPCAQRGGGPGGEGRWCPGLACRPVGSWHEACARACVCPPALPSPTGTPRA